MSDPRFSYSSLQTYKKCPLAFKFRYLDRLELREEGLAEHHKTWGRAYHESQAFLYQTRQETGKAPGVKELELASEIFKAVYPVQLDPNDKAKTVEAGPYVLEKYLRHWIPEDSKWKVIQVEGPGEGQEIEAGLNTIHIDLVMENLEHGGIYGFDHKTTLKPLTMNYWQQYEPNSQITHYTDYIQEKYGRCDGFYINAVSLNWREEKRIDGANNVALFELDDPGKSWRRFSKYEKRFIKGKYHRDMMAAWGLTCTFERQMFNRNGAQIQQERDSVDFWIARIQQSSFKGEWGFNTDACTWCEYKLMCQPGYVWPADQELISLQYRQVCGEVIPVPCETCGGNGVDPKDRETLRQLISDDNWPHWGPGTFVFSPCPICNGSCLVPGPRCVLDLDHTGPCSPIKQPEEELEIEVRV